MKGFRRGGLLARVPRDVRSNFRLVSPQRSTRDSATVARGVFVVKDSMSPDKLELLLTAITTHLVHFADASPTRVDHQYRPRG